MSDGGAGETPARRLTHKQAVEIALNDPAVRRAVAATESPLAIQRRQLYRENARGARTSRQRGSLTSSPLGICAEVMRIMRAPVPVLFECCQSSYLMLSGDIVRNTVGRVRQEARRACVLGFLSLRKRSAIRAKSSAVVPQRWDETRYGALGEVPVRAVDRAYESRLGERGGWPALGDGLPLKGVGPEKCVHAVQFVAPCLDQAGAGQGLEGAARQCWCHPGEGGDGSWFDAGCGVQSGEPEGSGGEIV